MPKIPPRLIPWLKGGISLGILALLFTQADLPLLAQTVTDADPIWMLLGVTMILSEPAILSLTWSAILRDKGFMAPFPSVLRISLVSDFLGFIIPSSLGSDVVKAVGLSKYISDTAEGLSSLFVIRAVSYLVLFAVTLFTILIFRHRLPQEAFIDGVALLLAAGFLVGAALLPFANRLLGMIKARLLGWGFDGLFARLFKLYETFAFYQRTPKTLLKAAAGGFLSQVNRVAYLYVIALSLRLDVDWTVFFVFVPVVTVVTMLPISMAGIGIREGGYVLLFSYAGLSVAETLGLSILGFALNLTAVLLGGLVYLIGGFPDPEALEKLRT